MALPKEAIEEFKEIYKKETGKTIPDEEAVIEANKFLNFMKLILKPIPKDANNKKS